MIGLVHVSLFNILQYSKSHNIVFHRDYDETSVLGLCVCGRRWFEHMFVCLCGSVPLFKHAGSAISKCVGGYICAGLSA